MKFKEWVYLTDGTITPYDVFARWYDSHRGDWREVEAAAKNNIQINKMLIYLSKNLKTPYGPLFQSMGNRIQQMVHPYNIDDPNDKNRNDAPVNIPKGSTKPPNPDTPNNGFKASAPKQGFDLTRKILDHEKRLTTIEKIVKPPPINLGNVSTLYK